MRFLQPRRRPRWRCARRLQAAEGESEAVQLRLLNRAATETVMDETTEDSLSLAEGVPAGTVEEAEDAEALRQLIDRADALRGPGKDPKLHTLIERTKKLVQQGFRPVVFCRYIATAHYVGAQLKHALPARKAHVAVITGELTSTSARNRWRRLENSTKASRPCL